MSPRPKKNRVPIPAHVAAEVLFLADRTCCVCRDRNRPVQIHHIDDDPGNNLVQNLSVLCLECHRETQISGGFDRKLDAAQVTLYRDDWLRVVADARATSGSLRDEDRTVGVEVELATSLAEIYRDQEDWVGLALHYWSIGNDDLAARYTSKAIEAGVSVQTKVLLCTRIAGCANLVTTAEIEEALTDTSDWTSRARRLRDLGRTAEAVSEYISGIQRRLNDGNVFTAAYYLKELSESSLIAELFKIALAESVAEDDLWWQQRAMQELGWTEQRRNLLLQNAERIRAEGATHFLRELAWAESDEQAYVKARMDEARSRAALRVTRETTGKHD
ncbi:HNH endonuclease signature motif containing protein [Nocardioides sp. Kera G14]|uniref:HNH endonuclease signature motif containing protein n=1 Tax=Nocardioides sp. Kera G14 TaxID=2884264 RepID=UPI001D1002D4|nr:HNH endonuclease signature motif containing protein [Nocardioides sp. Kera G14]UDY22932.1 HNH endonuclease [Nocardioides sp. Kera G14]